MLRINIHPLAILVFGLGLLTVGMSVPVILAKPPEPLLDENRWAAEFKVDSLHSSLVFRVKHLDASYFYGRFNDINGAYRVDDNDLENSYVRIQVPSASVDTNNEGRDKHLKSQDFFSAKEFPDITFKSVSISKTDEDAYEVTGDLSFRGVTRSVTFDARHTGTASVSERFGLRSGYEAVIDIKRSDFGVTYGLKGDVLGDEVRLIVSLEGMVGE